MGKGPGGRGGGGGVGGGLRNLDIGSAGSMVDDFSSHILIKKDPHWRTSLITGPEILENSALNFLNVRRSTCWGLVLIMLFGDGFPM